MPAHSENLFTFRKSFISEKMGSEYKIGGKKGEIGGKDAYQNLMLFPLLVVSL